MGNKAILQQVKDTYSAIAEEFDISRHHPWPEFKLFLKRLLPKLTPSRPIKLLDIGCGNGRLSHFLKDYPIQYVGVDNNRTMIRIAKKKNPHVRFRYGDVQKLPFQSHTFDTVWAIALLHHLPTKKLRLQALREMKRVLKPNSPLFLMVWNLWRSKHRKLISQKTHEAFIPWGTAKKWKRYYYAFRLSELRALIYSAGFHNIKHVPAATNLAFIAYEKSKNSRRSV